MVLLVFSKAAKSAFCKMTAEDTQEHIAEHRRIVRFPYAVCAEAVSISAIARAIPVFGD